MYQPKIYDKSRLDILIYAQDGRGIGHVSRSAAVAMALRRLYPNLKILLISGFRETQMLLGESPVDWVKLPAYETQIISGKAEGKRGDTNLKNCYLGPARKYLLESVVREFKPRYVMVDHLPCGRRNELELAHLLSRQTTTHWVLGVRGIPGADQTFWSKKSKQAFVENYSLLLWYGDVNILGDRHIQSLKNHFDMWPSTMGYVSRYREVLHWQRRAESEIGGVLSIPWLSQTSIHLLEEFYQVLKRIGKSLGKWVIYTKLADLQSRAKDQQRKLENLPFCRFKQISNHYFSDLQSAHVLVTYGGYNSLSDILAAKIPAVVICRKLNDTEQDHHVAQLHKKACGVIYPIAEESMNAALLQKAIVTQHSQKKGVDSFCNLNGAENTAHYLAQLLKRDM